MSIKTAFIELLITLICNFLASVFLSSVHTCSLGGCFGLLPYGNISPVFELHCLPAKLKFFFSSHIGFFLLAAIDVNTMMI